MSQTQLYQDPYLLKSTTKSYISTQHSKLSYTSSSVVANWEYGLDLSSSTGDGGLSASAVDD